MKNNYEELRESVLNEGASLFGIADISEIKNSFMFNPGTLKGLERAISVGLALSGEILEEIIDRPSKLYFYHYRQANIFLDQLALKITTYLQKKNFMALPVPSSQIVDWEKQIGHLSHKRIGELAGLGWIGRNNLLVNKDLGSRFRLVTILTDMPLPANSTEAVDSCGDCRDCIAVCPAGAIKEKRKDFDFIRCFEKLKEFRSQGLVDQFVCGICVKACHPRPNLGIPAKIRSR